MGFGSAMSVSVQLNHLVRLQRKLTVYATVLVAQHGAARKVLFRVAQQAAPVKQFASFIFEFHQTLIKIKSRQIVGLVAPRAGCVAYTQGC